VVLQFLQEKQLFETLAQFESETGVTFNERHLPVAGMLEACLDMFGGYCNSETVATQSEQDKVGNEAEEALQKLETGICCTGRSSEIDCPAKPFAANVTAVAWAAARYGEMLAVVATADRKLQLLSGAEVLAEFTDLASPPLGLNVATASEV
ncbi:unnamed protein product, partial [Polarella glacialis]